MDECEALRRLDELKPIIPTAELNKEEGTDNGWDFKTEYGGKMFEYIIFRKTHDGPVIFQLCYSWYE